MQSRAESKNSGHPRKEEERSHWTLNWFSGCWYKISFLAPEVYCGSAKEGSQRFCSFFFSIGLPHFLQPSRIFQCRYHQNEPCTLGWILICWQHKRQKSHLKAACQKHALNESWPQRSIKKSYFNISSCSDFSRRWKSGTFHLLLVENDLPSWVCFSVYVSTFWL